MMKTHGQAGAVLWLVLLLPISGVPAFAQTADIARPDAPAAPSIDVTAFASAGGPTPRRAPAGLLRLH